MEPMFTLSRRSLLDIMFQLVWMTIPIGIFLLLNQEYLWGVILSALGAAAIIGMLSNQLIQSFEARNIPVNRGYFMAFGFGASAAITALYIFLLVQPSRNLAWFGMPYAVGILVLGTWAAIQVLRSMRNRNIPA